jgi:hypothetical protein
MKALLALWLGMGIPAPANPDVVKLLASPEVAGPLRSHEVRASRVDNFLPPANQPGPSDAESLGFPGIFRVRAASRKVAPVATDIQSGAVTPQRLSAWLTAVFALPSLFHALVRALPLHGYSATPLELQLLNLSAVCLFFSPAFLPWVSRFAGRAWAGATLLGRVVQSALVLLALWAAIDAARWVIGMMYQPGGEPVVPMPDLAR